MKTKRAPITQDEYSRVWDSVATWAFDHATDVDVQQVAVAICRRYGPVSADALEPGVMQKIAAEFAAIDRD